MARQPRRRSTPESRTLSAAPSIEYADLGDVEDAIKEWTPEQISCRAGGHRRAPGSIEVAPDGSSAVMNDFCERCRVPIVQTVIINQYGRAVLGGPAKYSYADAPGYLRPGLGRLDREARAMLRWESRPDLQAAIERARKRQAKGGGK